MFLDSLIGAINIKGTKRTNFALKDDIYILIRLMKVFIDTSAFITLFVTSEHYHKQVTNE